MGATKSARGDLVSFQAISTLACNKLLHDHDEEPAESLYAAVKAAKEYLPPDLATDLLELNKAANKAKHSFVEGAVGPYSQAPFVHVVEEVATLAGLP
jgi:hypothetical protein